MAGLFLCNLHCHGLLFIYCYMFFPLQLCDMLVTFDPLSLINHSMYIFDNEHGDDKQFSVYLSVEASH